MKVTNQHQIKNHQQISLMNSYVFFQHEKSRNFSLFITGESNFFTIYFKLISHRSWQQQFIGI